MKKKSNYDVIVALAFGERHAEPGISNIDISALVSDQIIKYQRPAILQREIFNILSKEFIPGSKRFNIKNENGGYLDTREVLLRVRKICRANEWNKILLIAHPEHIFRSQKTAEKLGLVCIKLSSPIRYDEKSTQWWTRSKFLYWVREIPVLFYYKLKGWI